MKKLFAVSFVLLTISIFLFVACEKEEEDYRMKWIGRYKCEKESNFASNSTQTVFLNVTLADGDSLLYIKEEKENVPLGSDYQYIDVKVKADTYGDMWYCSGINALNYNFRASFYCDSIYVRYYLLLGQNSAPRFIYKGQKIE
ncbi:MAG: hypothetical protein IKO34_10320 [Bacteroidales bacterium]|nr:hypothetical protein [Bacteroidales bacterium]